MPFYARWTTTTNTQIEVIHQAISWIRDLAYEAEDIVEMYSNGVTHRRELEEISHILKWFFCGSLCNPCDAVAQHQVGADIDALREKLQHVTSQLQRYTIGGSVCVKSSGSSTTVGQQEIKNKAFLNLLEDEPVGLDHATEDLAKKFADANIKVVGISGMGGIGKSTLAKKVYKKVQNKFDCFAWVFVSQQFQRAHVWRDIITQLDKGTYNITDNDLPNKLDQLLRNNRCLVVLDDLWTEADWDQLKPAFLPINHEFRSKLLVTTRRRELLENVDPRGYPYELQALNEEQSWDLFKRKIRPENVLDDSKKKELGREIVCKCKGLPLAIVALTGILSKKKIVEEWNIINLNLKNIHQDRNGIVMRVLELSYNDLPHYLRPCFLYLAIYPEDYIVSVEKLQHLWEAEGFLELRSTITGDTLKNVGMSYLIELVERFLIIVDRKTRSGKMKRFHLHDMIRDMCISKAKEENFIHMITEGEESGTVLLDGRPIRSEFKMGVERIHRLAVHGLHDEGSLKFSSTKLFKEWSHVRSLVFHHSRYNHQLASYVIKGAAQTFSLLRVLDMGGRKNVSSFPIMRVGGLKYLRYLSLEGSDLKLVPFCIRELRWLITLDLRVCFDQYLPGIFPNLFGNLKRLKHLYLPQFFWCVGGCSLNLSSLTRLETLVNFDIDECRIKDLYKLTNLKKFRTNGCYFNDSTRKRIKHFLKCCTTLSNACTKPFLVRVDIALLLREPNSLHQLWKTSVGDPSLYQVLGYWSFITHLHPSLILESAFPSNLEYLTLQGIQFQVQYERDPMQLLQNKLPRLKCLCLCKCLDIEVSEIVCSQGGFPQLTTLVLIELGWVDKLKIEKGVMPNLIRICTDRCHRMNKKYVFVGGKREKILVIHGSKSDLRAYWTPQRGFKKRALSEAPEGIGHENTRMYETKSTADNIEDESVDQRNRNHPVEGSARFDIDTISEASVSRDQGVGDDETYVYSN